MIRKTDANHKEIMSWLRQVPGTSVFSTHAVGKGFPDLVVGFRKRNYLVEIKDGTKPPSARRLTADEAKFHEGWQGQVSIVNGIEDLIKLLEI
jgi:hypothetical protein